MNIINQNKPFLRHLIKKYIFYYYFSSMNNKEEEEEIHFEKERVKAIKESFKEEICFLEKEGAITLANMHIQEQYMNEKKEVNRYDVIEITDAVENFLRILSLMDAYRYFQSKNQALTDKNIGDFLLIVKNDFLIRQNKFLIDFQTQKKSMEFEIEIEMKVDNPM